MNQFDPINSLPLYNFSRDTGWNPIEMWFLGASPVISGDTPASNVQYTFEKFMQSFGVGLQDQDIVVPGSQDEASKGLPDSTVPRNKAKVCADKNGKVVPCTSIDRIFGGSTVFGTPPFNPNANTSASPQTYPSGGISKEDDKAFEEYMEKLRTGGLDASKEAAVQGVPCGRFDIPCQVNKILKDNAANLVFMSIGIILLAIAVYVLVK